MSVAYVATSCLVALAFGETKATWVRRVLGSCDLVYASNLLEAELRATFVRERVPWQPALLTSIGWILPGRRLTGEIERVLEAGCVRGADAWHVACALYLSDEIGGLDFITLDDAQRAVAAKTGLRAAVP